MTENQKNGLISMIFHYTTLAMKVEERQGCEDLQEWVDETDQVWSDLQDYIGDL